jgi:hypothetical protein
MEFADLLDDVGPMPTPAPTPDPEPVCVGPSVFTDPIPVAVSFPSPVVAEPVVAAPVVAELDLSLADLVMFAVPHRFESEPRPALEQADEIVEAKVEEQVEAQVEAQIEAPARVSRFAAAGLDDDLLPVHAARRRLRR